ILLEDRILSRDPQREDAVEPSLDRRQLVEQGAVLIDELQTGDDLELLEADARELARVEKVIPLGQGLRSEEHTSELQSLMRISYAVFCLKKKTTPHHTY